MTTKAAASAALARTGLEPRGLSREQAAAYVGVSPTLFDQLVASGQMPAPRRINSRSVWDRRDIDSAFDRLPQDSAGDPAGDDIWGQARA